MNCLMVDRNLALYLVGNYISELESQEPDFKYSNRFEYDKWSAAKNAATAIYECIQEGYNPIYIVETYTAQMAYYSQRANNSGKYLTSTIFSIESDTASDIANLFTCNGIHYMENYIE